MQKYSFDFPEDFVEETYFNQAEYNYHYGADFFLYAKHKVSGEMYVLFDAEWHNVQDAEFDWNLGKDELSFDSSNEFYDAFGSLKKY